MKCHFCRETVLKPNMVKLPSKDDKVCVCGLCKGLVPKHPAKRKTKKKPAIKKESTGKKEAPIKKKPATKKKAVKKTIKAKGSIPLNKPNRNGDIFTNPPGMDMPVVKLMHAAWESFSAGCQCMGIDPVKSAKVLAGQDVLPPAPETPKNKTLRTRVGAKKCAVCKSKYAELNEDWALRVLMRATASLSKKSPQTVRAMSMSRSYLPRNGYPFICPPCALENMEALTDMVRSGQRFDKELLIPTTKASADAIKEDEEFYIKQAKKYMEGNGFTPE